MQKRDYQEAAISSVIPWMRLNPDKNGLIVLATGTGKSYVQSRIIKNCLELNPRAKILCATHVSDLVKGNYEDFVNLMPFAQAGIYSAGLKRYDTQHQVIFGGIQSMINASYDFGFVNILFVDEAHTISNDDSTRWRQFISALKSINPKLRVIGLSATPFRLDSGNLCTGENAMFDEIIYEYGLMEGINDGYLTALVPKYGKADIDFSEAHLAKNKGINGDYKESYLSEVTDRPEITRQVVDEIMRYGHDRKTWMVFCADVEHCNHMRDEIRSRGISCEAVTGKTKQKERDHIYDGMKDGSIRAACSVAVMTTGTNIPNIDMIAWVRKTASGGLLVQMGGRGTRVIYEAGAPLETVEQRLQAIANGPKPNCLCLDFVGNIREHGPLDKIKGYDKKKRDQEGPSVPAMKECPKCDEIIMASFRACPSCEHEFPEPERQIDAESDNAAMLSNQKVIDVFTPDIAYYYLHRKKDNPNSISMRVEYMCGMTMLREWVKIDRMNWRFKKWWQSRSKLPFPQTTEEAVQLGPTLRLPKSIYADVSGKYPNIERHIFEEWPQEAASPDLDQMFELCDNPIQDDLVFDEI